MIIRIRIPDSPGLHESESALHEEDDDAHDEEEEVVDLLRLLVVNVVALPPDHLGRVVRAVVVGDRGQEGPLEQGQRGPEVVLHRAPVRVLHATELKSDGMERKCLQLI